MNISIVLICNLSLITYHFNAIGAIEKKIILLPVLPDAEHRLQLAVGLKELPHYQPLEGEETMVDGAGHTRGHLTLGGEDMLKSTWKKLQQQYADSMRYVKYNKIHGLFGKSDIEVLGINDC